MIMTCPDTHEFQLELWPWHVAYHWQHEDNAQTHSEKQTIFFLLSHLHATVNMQEPKHT